jgi:hypothetical protein
MTYVIFSHGYHILGTHNSRLFADGWRLFAFKNPNDNPPSFVLLFMQPNIISKTAMQIFRMSGLVCVVI